MRFIASTAFPAGRSLRSAWTLLGCVLSLAAAGLSPHRLAEPPLVPDPKMTPGDVLPVTKSDICVPGYTKKVRNVPDAVKKQVFASYGIVNPGKGEFEIDHLISLELGGSNSVRNLWPQSYKTQPWNAHVKDALENELHRRVCNGQLDLATAQREIAADWIGAYKKYIAPMPTKGRRSAGTRGKGRKATPVPAPAAGGQVWVNTDSGKYFLPGSRYYGKTKKGQYMSEADAIKQGYKKAQ